jgi:hypothetical protein
MILVVIYPRGLPGGKSASKVVNIAASKKMNSFADDDLRREEYLRRKK